MNVLDLFSKAAGSVLQMVDAQTVVAGVMAGMTSGMTQVAPEDGFVTRKPMAI
jgi:hypothetical protein